MLANLIHPTVYETTLELGAAIRLGAFDDQRYPGACSGHDLLLRV